MKKRQKTGYDQRRSKVPNRHPNFLKLQCGVGGEKPQTDSCIHSAVSIRPDGHSAIARRALAKRGADAVCMRQPDEPDLPTQPQTTTRKGVDEMYQRCHCVRPGSRQEVKLSPRDRAMRRVSGSLANCHATVQKLYLYDKSCSKYQLSLIDPCDKIVL